MPGIQRRNLLKAALASSTTMALPGMVWAEARSLTDLGGAMLDLEKATIFTARDIVTLHPDRPTAQAVAVVNSRILATGTLEEVKAMLGDQPHDVDRRFEDHVIVPGFIAQHDHPVLAGLTMSSEILAIEDWDLPGGTVPAVKDKDDFMTRLAAAEAALDDPEEPLLTWGYHAAFYGPLTRDDLDTISTTRPIFVWARSCHEFILNTAAMEKAGVTEGLMANWSPSANAQSSYRDGHFWEQGLFAVLPQIAPIVADPERFRAGLELMRDYMHANGVTYGNEPGGILSKPVQDAVNEVMSPSSMPFRWSFIADGKSLVAASKDDDQVIPATLALEDWYSGMTSMKKETVKLFADGAIYSLAIQLRQPPIGDYHGEWMMDLDAFERAFRIYWDAGYQVHVHVNGDAGLDRVLNVLEENLRRNPRYDHRTVIVHFAVSAQDQVELIRKLGAIVSANPYYVTALSDRYSETGLGPERADQMVRLADVERANISWSLHSDMPMAPGDPLFLMWCAVNRVTSSGRVAGENQRVTAEQALRGVTINAAWSHRLEDERGSIEPGKLANFTILTENPIMVDPMTIKDIGVWGTVVEGRVLQIPDVDQKDARAPIRATPESIDFAKHVLHHAISVVHAHL
ncbi:amidohydrolase [Roseibium sediminicola]|uniref:Amidohydrolase n=1 Tax=Roseibium sediminicola TaxID=2933272 RepID=A0ABT0GXV3_9HYPH|nr:amidohydrolase family protein [Roseibium sp. CAU 1639]MCK7614266.1 amidohydrolase [Roseibium sp. CAU 1639]